MFPILKTGIKIYNYESKFKGYSNLLLIYKNNLKKFLKRCSNFIRSIV